MVGHHSGENAGSIPVVSRPTLLSLESMDQLDIDRLHMHVMRGPSCWKWLGTLNTDGYGHFKINNKTYDAHRIAAMLAGMDIVGKVVRHTCDHPWCMNPDHLIPGTHADNVRDRVERGRSAICERNGRTKLTKQQARDISKFRSTLVII